MGNLGFNDLLTLIAFLASGALARPLVSFLNSFEEFVGLSSRLKVALVVIANTLITVGAMAVQQFVPSETLDTANPWFKSALAAAHMAWIVWNNQDAYQQLKASMKNATPEVK